MQAIEVETDISSDGHIRLSESLHNIFGSHARLIVLLDEKDIEPKLDAIAAFRGSGQSGSTNHLLMDRQTYTKQGA